jgi:amidase
MNESIVMPTAQVKQPSAVELLRQLARRQISAVELMTKTVQRMQTADRALNALVAVNWARSLEEAERADGLRKNGSKLPLLGLPVTVKDSIDVHGFRCTGGSYAREMFVPERDATSVARLRAGGAIIVGKTNVPEYSSSYETDNLLFGRTTHPLDVKRTPGGSSGGEGALLGADASIVGLGLDGGGSIRVPSHYCGTVGIRPTVGRVPDTGSWPRTRATGYRDLMCIGPMARYVEDLILLLPVISGPDWIDPYAVPGPLGDPHTVDVRALRVGFYVHDGLRKVSVETAEAIERAAALFARLGARVIRITPPNLSEATRLFLMCAGADGGDRIRRDLAEAGGKHNRQLQALLAAFGEPMPLADFFDLQDKVFDFRQRYRAFAADHDVLVCPVTTGPAPLHGQPPWGIELDDYDRYEGFNYTHALSLAGMPVVVVPVGTQDGLPIGVQIVSQPYEEHIALAAALALETGLKPLS